MEGDPIPRTVRRKIRDFYPRPPGGGRPKAPRTSRSSTYFYPRPPGGGRRRPYRFPTWPRKFLSTPSGWRATLPSASGFLSFVYFYPRPPGGGRLHADLSQLVKQNISIHALRVEGDAAETADSVQKIDISIHALRVEGDGKLGKTVYQHDVFLSTPSGWRATAHRGARKISRRRDFYPRPPGGGRPSKAAARIQSADFYPRPPGGGRRDARMPRMGPIDFYPRPPGGGRRKALAEKVRLDEISIHALRVEGDVGFHRDVRKAVEFLSTPSGWRATRRSI